MLSNLQTRWRDPFDTMRREFERGFASFNGGRLPQQRVAPVSLREDAEHVYVEVDLPGMTADDVDLTVEDGKLWIRGQRKAPEYQQQCWHDERWFGPFERAIVLADTIDAGAVTASLHDGVLYITLGKKPEAKPQKVAVQYQGQPERIEAEATPAQGDQG
ncbi:MAG: Hsp20/alpha crystallin family protein [Planctomycetes bacterium]|nr:Hsp20/alpha crystallin family protein [Planctomycetota bacterium]